MGRYRIVFRGEPPRNWGEWFEGMTLTSAGELSILTGRLADQAALRGLLSRLWDFNLAVVSLENLEEEDG